MRILASITAAMLFTFMLAAVPGFAQEDKPDHAQEQSKKDKDKDAKGAKQDDNARPNENRRDESRPEGRDNSRPEKARPDNGRSNNGHQQEQTRPEERRNDNMGRQEQARPEEHGGRNQRAAGEHRGQRIPEEKFRASFGREHHFHVQRAQIVNQAQPQFIYGGYTFVLQQTWPSEWSYDDDCYIEYVDGDYYLYDVYHPGIQILVFVIG